MNSIQTLLTTSPFNVAGISQALFLIIALPLIGAAVCGIFGKAMGRGNTALVGCAAVGGAFILSVIAFWSTVESTAILPNLFGGETVKHAISFDYGTWFEVKGFRANLGLSVDHLSGILLLVITGVGFLIHLYSSSYMEHDEGYWRFFAYLNLFVGMMLTLVLADNLVLLFVGWEGVGMCSYLLIGFWYTDPAKAYAGRKAFVTNRIGDFGFLIGAFLLVLLVGAVGTSGWQRGLAEVGPLNFQTLRMLADSLRPLPLISVGPLTGMNPLHVLTVALLCFMLGAAGKSAQLPLYVWLPDAMAGPTPVSALIHAATMVTAGVYLFCRLSFLLVLSPFAMSVVAVIGALTAFVAALIAFAQDDIKKVLAYSTVSQLGFMFMGVGMGVFWAAVFHLVTHAFFKACLFLGAGSVMHGNGDETDIKKLGGLRKEMPITWLTFLIATLAITGIVPLSGFFSKDAILHGVHDTSLVSYRWVSPFVYGMGLLTAGLTAFYMVRVYLLTFEGKRSTEARVPHAHESAIPMTLPLMVLAGLSIVALAYGLPLVGGEGSPQALMENFLSPVFATANRLMHSSELIESEHGLVPLSGYLTAWALALFGGGAAAFAYLRFFPSREGKPTPAPILALGQGIQRFARNKFYVDEVYDFLILRRVRQLSRILYKVLDARIIDAVFVRGTAWLTMQLGSALRYLQTGDTQSYAAVMALALVGGVAYALFQVFR